MMKLWPSIVTIAIKDSTTFYSCIQNTRDAAHYLLENWPGLRSPNYCAAIRLCTKALKGESTDEAAYISFVAAAREANVAHVLNRRRNDADQLEIEIQQAVAENVLSEFRGL